MMITFLTDFDSYINQDLFDRIKEHLKPRKNEKGEEFTLAIELFKKMREKFINHWK